jgi:hypothetical protein
VGGKFKNPTTGETRYVHDDEMAAASSAGWVPVGHVSMQDQSGGVVTLSPEDVQVAYGQSAFKPEFTRPTAETLERTAEERAARQVYDTAADAAIAVGEGALSSATLGGSDWLLDKAGAATSKREKIHPGARSAGEILGIVATAGAGAAAAAGKAGGLASALAKTPAGLVSRGAASAGERLGGGLIGSMGREIIEGTAFGGAQTISNVALDNVDFTAEAIADDFMTNGIIYGAGGGAAFGAVSHGIGKLAEKFGGGLNKAEQAATKMGDTAEGVYGAAKVSESLGRLDTLVSKAEADADFAAKGYRWSESYKPFKEDVRLIRSYRDAVNEEDIVSALRREADGIEGSVVRAGNTLPDDLDSLVAMHANVPPPARLFTNTFRTTREVAQDSTAFVEMNFSVMPPDRVRAARAAIKRVNALHGDLVRLTPAEELDELGRPRVASRKGTKAVGGLDIDGQRTYAKKLIEYRAAVQQLDADFAYGKGFPSLSYSDEVGERFANLGAKKGGYRSFQEPDDVKALENFANGQHYAYSDSQELYAAARAGDEEALATLTREVGAPATAKHADILKATGEWEATLTANSHKFAKAKALRELADQAQPFGFTDDALERLGQAGSSSVHAMSAETVLSQRLAWAREAAEKLGNAKEVGRLDNMLDSVSKKLRPSLAKITGKAPKFDASMPVVKALEEAKAARLAIRAQLGDDLSLEAISQLPTDKAVPVLSALNDYFVAAKAVSKDVPEFKKTLDEIASMMSEAGAPKMDLPIAEALAAVGVIGLTPDLEGPVDDIATLWVASKMMGGGGAGGGKRAVGHHKKALINMLGRSGSRVASGMVGRLLPGTGIAFDAMRGAASAAGQTLGVDAGHVLAGTHALAKRTGGVRATIGNVAARLASGAQAATRVAAPAAGAVLNNYSFNYGDPAPKKKLPMRQAFEQRAKELAEIAANPMGVQRQINENLRPLRKVNDLVGDRLEMIAIEDAMFFYEKLPKDKGGNNFFGSSKWRASEQDITTFAAYMRGLDSVGVWERAVSGRMTPQEAEFLRVRRPYTFSQIQQSILENLPEIQANATGDQRTRLSILFNVPVDPLVHKSSFFQQQFAERSAEDQKPVDFKANALKPETPTQTQNLQSR